MQWDSGARCQYLPIWIDVLTVLTVVVVSGSILTLAGWCWLLSFECWPANKFKPGGFVCMQKQHLVNSQDPQNPLKSKCMSLCQSVFMCFLLVSSLLLPGHPQKLNPFMEKTLTIGLTLFLTLCVDIPGAGGQKAGARGDDTQKASSRPSDPKGGRCSYTFIVPQQKLTGALCLKTQSASANRSEVAALRAELRRQQQQLQELHGQLEQEGALAMEVRGLRKESNSMNSRIAQLYAQLLHEVIQKRDRALEQQRVESVLLNATTQVSRGHCIIYTVSSPSHSSWCLLCYGRCDMSGAAGFQ